MPLFMVPLILGKNNWSWEVQTDPWDWAKVKSLEQGPKRHTEFKVVGVQVRLHGKDDEM